MHDAPNGTYRQERLIQENIKDSSTERRLGKLGGNFLLITDPDVYGIYICTHLLFTSVFFKQKNGYN
jgi:hypothetical protein